jgi:glyoxylase-like metal-dependent hydrolase (beta-lactamase superfamily II)
MRVRLKPDTTAAGLKPDPTNPTKLDTTKLDTTRWWIAAGVAVMVQAALLAQVPTVAPSPLVHAPMIQPPPAGEIEVLPIRGNIYALVGAGANIVASVGPDGVLLVDAGTGALTDKVVAALAQLQREWSARNEPKPLGWGAETRSSVVDRHIVAPPKPIRYIINTGPTPDHVGGNEKLRNAGRTITGGNVAGDIRDSGEGAAILAHENVLVRLSQAAEGRPAPPPDALPTDTYFNDYYKLSHFFNGEGVQLLHMPKANTDGDSIVYFRGSDVIALGDLMATESYPVFDTEKGGSINGIIDGLNAVLDLAITEFRLEGGTMMVPGHGRIVDSGDVAYYRDMLTIIRDRVQDMVTKEMTLDEVKAARPAADYDTEYGKTPGWTSDTFIEAVYKSLGGGRTPPRPPARRKP